jgi:hypothetical protein
LPDPTKADVKQRRPDEARQRGDEEAGRLAEVLGDDEAGRRGKEQHPEQLEAGGDALDYLHGASLGQ